jgi:hypothetical protein
MCGEGTVFESKDDAPHGAQCVLVWESCPGIGLGWKQKHWENWEPTAPESYGDLETAKAACKAQDYCDGIEVNKDGIYLRRDLCNLRPGKEFDIAKFNDLRTNRYEWFFNSSTMNSETNEDSRCRDNMIGDGNEDIPGTNMRCGVKGTAAESTTYFNPKPGDKSKVTAT